jgi:trans-2-enoyl-CoA reductase
MTVNRTTDGPDAATMTVFFEFVNQESPAGASGYERTTIIDMLDKQDSRILRELLEKTGAKDIKATEEEERELQQLAEERVKSEQDRARVKLEQDARRREKQMLERARGLGTASNA